MGVNNFLFIYKVSTYASAFDDNEWPFKDLFKWFEGFSKKLVLWVLITFIYLFIEFQTMTSASDDNE